MTNGMTRSDTRKRTERQTTHYIAEGETRCWRRSCDFTKWLNTLGAETPSDLRDYLYSKYHPRSHTINPNRVIELGTVSVARVEK